MAVRNMDHSQFNPLVIADLAAKTANKIEAVVKAVPEKKISQLGKTMIREGEKKKRTCKKEKKIEKKKKDESEIEEESDFEMNSFPIKSKPFGKQLETEQINMIIDDEMEEESQSILAG